MLSRVVGFVRETRRTGGALKSLFASADGRWTLVSTGLTAVVAMAVTALSLAAAPPSASSAFEARQTQTVLPYDLLARLTGRPVLPGIATEDYRAAGLIGGPGTNNPLATVVRGAAELIGPLDGVLEAQQAGKIGPENRTLTVHNGDTIMGMLQEAGVPQQDAVAVVEAMRPIFSPKSVRPGQTFEASFGLPQTDAARDDVTVRLLSLSFSPSVERQITVSLTGPAEYSAEEVQKQLNARYQHAGATIDSSLYLAAMQAGIPASIVVEMIHMFSYDVDFQRDVHPGDSFDVFFNHYYTPDGAAVKTGDIFAATMTLGGKQHTLYRYESENGVEYFDPTGSSAKSMLMKTPVDGARISSGFGYRRHPVLGYGRMHKGIDFAVPKGTPVMAAGDGTVASAGRNTGYGNLLVINHSNGYATAYGHLSRFAPGIHAGSRVRQGQLVAYSGNTGLSTGPHLHYEIRVKGAQVNPNSIKIASGRKLEGQELRAFTAERSRIDRVMASLPIKNKMATADGGLRDTTER